MTVDLDALTTKVLLASSNDEYFRCKPSVVMELIVEVRRLRLDVALLKDIRDHEAKSNRPNEAFAYANKVVEENLRKGMKG